MKKYKRHSKFHDYLRNTFLSIVCRISPKMAISIAYRGSLHKKMDWKDPKDLNEKINWLKIYGDTSRWAQLSDKYEVRNFIKERGVEELLVKLYGVWDSPDDIDFSKLPDRFVMKMNNGCNSVILVTDKSKLDVDMIKKQFKKWMKERFGLATIELHYLDIKPRIIAEQLLENDNKESESLVDYKFWCLDGEPYYIFVCIDRVLNKGMRVAMYDTNWNLIPNMLDGPHKNDNVDRIEKPACFEQMLNYARILSKGFPEVRVDLYESKGKVYFGEMTFTSQGGFMKYFTPEKLLEMGAKVTLPIRHK